MRLIKQSISSLLLFVSSFSALAFYQTFGSDYFVPATIMTGLLIAGFFGSFALEKFTFRKEDESDEVVEETPSHAFQLGIFALLALGAFAILNFIVPELKLSANQVGIITFFGIVKLPTTSFATFTGAVIFGALLIPNAEEQFFRGLWGNLAVRFVPPGIAELLAGAIFMVFHAQVYQLFYPATNWSLVIILLSAGAVFVAVDLQTENITTSIIAHGANNGLTFLVGGSIISYLFPGLLPPGISPVALSLVVPAIIMAYRYKHGFHWRRPRWVS